MAGEVPVWGSAVAEDVEESKKYDVVVSGGACLLQGAFAAVLAPLDGDLTGGGQRGIHEGECQEKEQCSLF